MKPAQLLLAYQRLVEKERELRDEIERVESLLASDPDVAHAEVARNQCLVCHVTVTSSGMQALRKGEEIVHCENCGRILVIA